MTRPPLLLLLHGALGSEVQLQPLAEHFSDREVSNVRLHGHGGDPVPAEGFQMATWLEQLTSILAKRSEPVDVFGYSMGGYLAVALARNHPHKIRRIVTYGTKWTWSPEIAAREVRYLDPEVIREKVPQLASRLATYHGEDHWPEVVQATATLLTQLGESPLLGPEEVTSVAVPVTVCRGERDRMVTEAESLETAERLPHGFFVQLARQPHPIEQVDLHELQAAIRRGIS